MSSVCIHSSLNRTSKTLQLYYLNGCERHSPWYVTPLVTLKISKFLLCIKYKIVFVVDFFCNAEFRVIFYDDSSAFDTVVLQIVSGLRGQVLDLQLDMCFWGECPVALEEKIDGIYSKHIVRFFLESSRYLFTHTAVSKALNTEY